MAQPRTLSVEIDELMARADELEAPIPGLPTQEPASPCDLRMARDANMILTYDSDALRIQIAQFAKERTRLAQSLRNAAKTYELIDEGFAQAINGTATMSGAASGDDMMSINCDPDPWDPPYPDPTPPPLQPEPVPYVEVRQAATEIAAPDQGDALVLFAQEWTRQQQQLLAATERFVTFDQWEGDTALRVETNFEQYRQWLISMAHLISSVATEARNMRTAHRTAVAKHPTVAQLTELDRLWTEGSKTSQWSQIKPQLQAQYAAYQQTSEDVLTGYSAAARLPLNPVNPPKPPVAIRIDAPSP